MRTQTGVVHRGLRFVGAAAITLALALSASAAPAHAQDAAGSTVKSLIIEGQYTTLSLTFDKGISKAEADKLQNVFAVSSKQVRNAGMVAMAPWPLNCGEGANFQDSNGTFSVQYNCASTRTLPWGYRISAAVQAIVVGNVNETGLRWWLNGAAKPQNAPHNVPPSYTIHGTMTPVISYSYVDYQDYMTFRHNVGSGGTGTLTFAGSLALTQ
ncbi:hypothetical protein [Phytohabitans kaempferiae]|uniref:Secreted protein n=1 Tax=Phytohabitans kaempferiae TaxID=1620943 RepID=A0ABV6M6D2_9ACTN